jgi:DNA-binding response OmpR family regulator
MIGFSRASDSSMGAGGQGERAILLYSADLDFCISFRLLFQRRFHLATTTDADMLSMTVSTMQPDVLVVDAPLTFRTQGKLAVLKLRHPHLRIVLLYVPGRHPEPPHAVLKQIAHAWFPKPINIAEVISAIDHLIAESAEELSEDHA